MRQSWDISVIGRLILVLVGIILLGITPRSHALMRLFQQVNQAFQNESPGEAARLTAKIAQQTPWRDDLWERAGGFAWQAGDYQSTITYLEQAASSADISDGSKFHLVDAYLSQGDMSKAETLLQDIRHEKPSHQVYVRLFQVHRLQKNYAAALEDIQALSELEPENANLPYLAGLLQMVLQPDEALTLLDKASSLNTHFEPTVLAVEDSLLLVKLTDEPVQGLMTGGQILAALEEWELAREAFHRVTLLDPDHAPAWAFLGEARQHENGNASFYAHLYALEVAERQPSASQIEEGDGYSDLQKALALDPKLATGHVFLSLYWARQHRYDLALDSVEDAIRLQPDASELYSQQGSIQAMLGDLSQALESYQRAVKLSDDDPQTSQLLISFCVAYEYQVKEVALPAVRELLQGDANDPAALDLAGQVFYLLDNPAAQIYLERALEQDPNYAPAHLHLGLYYLQQGNLALAKNEFALAQSLAAGSSIGDQAQRLLETYFP